MRNLLKLSLLSAGLLAALTPGGVHAAFTIGNLAVEQLYTNGTSSTFEIVELNPFITNTVPVNRIQIPYTGASALRQSSAGSTGRLALSQDRTLLAFTAAEDPVGVTDETTITNRGIGTVDANGNYVLQGSYKGIGSKSNQARSATSLDDTTWYCGDKGGIYTNNSGTTPPNSTNVRPIKSFGGVLYALQDGSGSVVQQVTPGTVALTGLPGLATDANALDFYMFASGNNGTTNDTIYTDDGTNINKYCLVSGTWVSEGNTNCGVNADGLCAINFGTGAYIYVTTGTGGQVYKITDTAGYNATMSVNTNNNSEIYAGAVYLKGIDFAPIPKLYTEQLQSDSTSSQIYLEQLNPYLSNSVPVNTVAIPITGSSALRQANNGSTGRLALTGDRTLLAFTGVEDPNGVADEETISNRGVGTIDASVSGDYTLQASYVGLGGGTDNQTRSATSLNNSLWYIGDKGGIYTNNTVNPVNTTNVRPIKVFGGTVYVCAASSSAANPSVLDTLSLDATSLTALPGLESTMDKNAADFYMIQSGVNGTNYDIAYVNDGATVTKYCLVSGSWTSLGTASLGVTADGICALNIGGGAQLYVTTGELSKGGGSVVLITDTTGWNQAPVINTANNVVLYAGALYLKGIDFAPVGGNIVNTLNTPPTITPDPNASVDHPFTNTFTDNVTWRASITNIQVNGSTLPPAAYNTNVAGEIIFTPSASALLQHAGNVSIIYYATNFNADQVVQPIAPGAAQSFSITLQPVAPTANGGTLVGQPAAAVVDQYGNPVTNAATVTASPSSGWSFGAGSSATQPLVNGTATFTNLNAFSPAAVPAATISFTVSGLPTLPYTTTNSSAFSIPAPLSGGFTSGYLAVEQVDVASSANSTFSILELNPSATNPVPVRIFPVPATGTNGLRQSGSTGSTGDLADSDDGTLLCFSAGLWQDSTFSDVTAITNRGAGTFNLQGNYNLGAFYQGNGGSTADQPRSAVTIDDTTFFMGDKGGIYTNGNNINDAYIPYVSSTQSPANVRSMKSFGGTIYVLQQEGGTDPSSTVMATLPLPGSVATYLVELDGFPLDGTVLDFYALRSGNNGADYDTIYYIDGTNTTSGSLWKWNFTGTSNELEQQIWQNTGGSLYASWPTPNGGNGICAVTNVNGGVDIYYTTGSGDTTGNSVVHVYDSAAWNQPINLTETNIIYTAPAGVCLKGIAFAPLPAPGNVATYAFGALTNITYSATGGVGVGAGLTFQFNGTASASNSYAVWSTTNLFTPFSQWIYLGHPTEGSPGVYGFTDPSAVTNPVTFYKVTSP